MWRLATLGAAAVLASATLAPAQHRVLYSSSPAHEVGADIPTGGVVSLEDGQRIRLFDLQRLLTRELVGPYTGPVDAYRARRNPLPDLNARRAAPCGADAGCEPVPGGARAWPRASDEAR